MKTLLTLLTCLFVLSSSASMADSIMCKLSEKYCLKEVKGNVWEKSVLGNPIRLAGSKVRLLKEDVKNDLKKHLESYDNIISQAINSSLLKEINEQDDILANEEKNVRKLVDEFSKKLNKANIEVKAAVENEKEQKKIYGSKTASLKEIIQNLTSKKTNLLSQLEEQRELLADAQAQKNKEFSVQKTNIETKLNEKKIKTVQALQQRKATLKALRKKNRDKLSDIISNEQSTLNKLDDAKKRLRTSQRKFAESLRKKYIDNKIKISTQVKGKEPIAKLCFRIKNVGNKAVYNVVFDLLYNGKSLRKAGVKLSDFVLDSNFFPYRGSKSARIKIKNKYKEDIHGLPPGSVWPPDYSRCLYIRSVSGDMQRSFEKLGGFSPSGNFKLVIISAEIANPDELYSSNESYRKEWFYKSKDVLEFYKKEVAKQTLKLSETTEVANLESLRKEILNNKNEEIKSSEELYGNLRKVQNKLVTKAQSEQKVLESALKALKPEILSNDQTSALNVKIQNVEEQLRSNNDNLENLKNSLLPFTKLSQVATEKLIQLKEELNTWNKTLNYTKAKRASLSSKAGDYYESLKALALENYNSKTLNQLWLEDLIKLLMGADGLTVNANVDGQFLFNDVAKKESIIFTLADYKGTKLFWLQPLESSVTSQDLGDFNSIYFHNKNFQNIKEEVSRIVTK